MNPTKGGKGGFEDCSNVWLFFNFVFLGFIHIHYIDIRVGHFLLVVVTFNFSNQKINMSDEIYLMCYASIGIERV